MKEHLLAGLLPLAIVWLSLITIVTAERDKDPCRFFANSTRLLHPEDCSQEIICIDFKSVPGIKCTGSKPFYNKDTYKCETLLTDNSICVVNCTNMSGKFLADPKSCYGYYYCQDEKSVLYGHCPNMLHFNQTLQACVDTYQSLCSIKKLNFCTIVSSGVKFKDEKYCGRYNECVLNKKTKLLELKNEFCGINARYFNAAQGVCVPEPIEGCHPIPKNVCVVNKQIKKNYLVNDGTTCRGSFYCADVGKAADENPQWNQCPDNKFFRQEKQKCVDPKQVVCQKDRCDGSTRKFVVSSERGCRHYLLCESGVKVGEGTCGNSFFDEERATCTPEVVTYPACYYK